MRMRDFGQIARHAAVGLVLAVAALAPAAARGQQASQPAAPPVMRPATQADSLPLSMQQAVAMALEANLGLKAERLNVDVADESIAAARSAYLPRLTGGYSYRDAKSVPSDFTQGVTDISSSGTSLTGSFQQSLPWYGGGYRVSLSGNRNSQQGGLTTFNPRLSSSLTVDFSQPILRNFKTDSARVSVESSERRRSITDLQLEQRVVQTEANTRLAYLALVGAIESKKVAEQNMEIAQQSLRQARARVAVGQSPQIEIIQAEAEVAGRQEQLIVSQAQIETAEDALRSLVLEPSRSDFWDVRLLPTDTILLTERPADMEAAVKNALAGRLDLLAQRRDLEITDLNIALGKNNTLPSVDFNLSYQASGTGGTQFAYGTGFPPPIVSRSDRSLGSALGDTFSGAYPTWSVGVSVAYPLGRSAEEASYASAQVQKRQQELSIRQLELQVVREVREAARQVQNTFERVQATRTARTASEQQLEAEERRFAVGFSTTLELQVRQRDLASARINELNAMIAYNRALITLERVQKTQ